MSTRILLGVIAISVGAAFWGFFEWRYSNKANSSPEKVDLADVEKGEISENPHWIIGPHIAQYHSSVLAYTSLVDKHVVDPDMKINWCHYPIESIKSEEQKGESALSTVSVLVKTKRFKTAGEVPAHSTRAKSLQGIIVGDGGSLTEDERKLFQGMFPGKDLDKVLILEAHRTPTAPLYSFGFMAGGVLLALVCAWLIYSDERTPDWSEEFLQNAQKEREEAERLSG